MKGSDDKEGLAGTAGDAAKNIHKTITPTAKVALIVCLLVEADMYSQQWSDNLCLNICDKVDIIVAFYPVRIVLSNGNRTI